MSGRFCFRHGPGNMTGDAELWIVYGFTNAAMCYAVVGRTDLNEGFLQLMFVLQAKRPPYFRITPIWPSLYLDIR